MGTSISQDNAKFLDVKTNFKVHSSVAAMGTLVYAGNLWPVGVVDTTVRGRSLDLKVGAVTLKRDEASEGRQMRREIDNAFAEARAMVVAGYLKASAAIKGEEAAGLLMKKWFGTRQTGAGENDWWIGAHRIIGNLQTHLAQNINVYYRGDDSLIGRPNDYPGKSGNLTAQDVSGYAETYGSAADGNIGLCKLFFRRESGGVFKTALKGRDCVGGCLAHELSHNYCGTKDHDAVGGGSCYGETDCRRLARKRRRRAWYNADNIEYFCEDAYYGITASKTAISSGSVNSVSNIRDAHKQLADALAATPAKSKVAPGGPKPPTVVTGATALMRAQFQATAIAHDPSLSASPSQPASTGKVSALLARFENQ